MLYRLRRRLHYASFRRRTRKILTSPPIPCKADASCEIHTMLSGADVPLYLVAIKSFLRFYRNVGVVVHSDGTLDYALQDLIRRHLPGCRVIDRVEADRRASEAFDPRSTLYRWRAIDASYRRLVDTELHCEAPARIIMDADILLMNRPDEVIEWVERGGKPFLLGQPPSEPAPPTNRVPRHMQDVFKATIPALNQVVGAPVGFLDGTTAGFYGCSDELSLDRVQTVLDECIGLGIPMLEWGGEQCLVIYLLSRAGATRLDPTRYFNFFPSVIPQLEGACAVHFFGTYRFFGDAYPRAAREVVSDLFHLVETRGASPDEQRRHTTL
jgi:hypothetical protein